MYIMVFIYYWLLVFKKNDLEYTITSQRRCFNSFSLFYILFSHRFSHYIFLLSLFKTLCTKKHNVFNLYRISYMLIFYYVMYYIVLEICVGGRFLEDCFYFYSQQIISGIVNESLIP